MLPEECGEEVGRDDMTDCPLHMNSWLSVEIRESSSLSLLFEGRPQSLSSRDSFSS